MSPGLRGDPLARDTPGPRTMRTLRMTRTNIGERCIGHLRAQVRLVREAYVRREAISKHKRCRYIDSQIKRELRASGAVLVPVPAFGQTPASHFNREVPGHEGLRSGLRSSTRRHGRG